MCRWSTKANGTKSTHITLTTRRETCPPVHINNIQLPQTEEIKYLGLHLDCRLTWRNHIFAKWKRLGIMLTKMYWLLGRQSKLTTSSKLLAYKVVLKPVWTYGLQLLGTASTSNRNPRKIPVKGFTYDNRRTLACDECTSPTRPTHSISQGRNPTTKLLIQCPT
jgi:hypothetical protein